MKATRALAFLGLFSCTGIAAAFPYPIDPLVNGADMAGMQVTVTYADATTDTATWMATGSVSGAAVGTGWSLTESGDTLNQPGLGAAWTLDNTSGQAITALEIDAWAAQVFFDVVLEGADASFPLGYDEHTPGSRQGRPFTDDGTLGITPADIAYLDLLSAPDLYGKVQVTLGPAGLADGASFRFMIDTDKVPEPSLFGLMALGLAGLAWQRRRRKPAIVSPV